MIVYHFLDTSKLLRVCLDGWPLKCMHGGKRSGRSWTGKRAACQLVCSWSYIMVDSHSRFMRGGPCIKGQPMWLSPITCNASSCISENAATAPRIWIAVKSSRLLDFYLKHSWADFYGIPSDLIAPVGIFPPTVLLKWKISWQQQMQLKSLNRALKAERSCLCSFSQKDNVRLDHLQ